MARGNPIELSIKIMGKVDKSLIKALNTAQSNVGTLSTTMSKIGTAGLKAMGGLAAGTVTTLVQCTNEAAKFESQMGDVVKYVDGLADKNGEISDQTWGFDEQGNPVTYAQNYDKMSKALLDLSTQIPMTAEELTQLAAAAGQSGKSMSDLLDYDENRNIQGFLKDVAMMGTAMDISADQAGDWAAKWEVMLNMDHSQVMELADQINYLGANNATTAAEIASVVNNAASLGDVAGMSASATAALGTAMLAMGVDSAKTGSSINRIYTNMSKGASATKAQKEMWEELGFTAEGIAKSMQVDATGTLIDVFKAIGTNLPEERRVAALSTLFGQWAITGGAKITGNLSAFTDALEMVNDPSRYTGSMEREFVIKASTSEAVDKMVESTFKAVKIDIGTAFLPAKKEVSVAIIKFLNDLRAMPELGQIAQQLATLFGQGVGMAGDALKKATPYIQQFLDYLINNGPQVLSMLGKLTAVFAAMKFAPAVEGAVRGAGGIAQGAGRFLFGGQTSGTSAGGARGGGIITRLFTGGVRAGNAAAGLVSGAAGAARTNGVGTTLGALASSLFSGNGVRGTTQLLQTAAGSPGMLSGFQSVGNVIANSAPVQGIARYAGGVGASIGNFLNQSGIAGAARGTVGVTGQILSNIAGATGLTNLVNGGIGLAQAGAGKVVGGVTTLASNVINSAPVQAVAGFAGNVMNSAPAQGIASMASGAAGWLGNTLSSGAGMLGTIWGPIAGGFGSLLSGALPIVGVISSIIAVVSILYDNMDGLGAVIRSVFGEDAFKGFTMFKDGLDTVVNSVGKLMSGDIAGAFSPLRDLLFGNDEKNGLIKGDMAKTLAASFDSAMSGDITTAVAPLREKLFGTFDPLTESMQGGMFSGTGGNILAGMFDAVTTGAQTMVSVAGPILQSILGVVGQVVSFANTTVKPIIEQVFAYITQTVIPSIANLLVQAAPTVGNILANVGTAVMTAAQIVGLAIQNLLPIIEGIISVVLSIASVVVPAVLAGIEALSAGIVPIIQGVQQIFQGLIDFVTGVFTGNWQQAWNAVKDIFAGAFNALEGLLKTPLNAVISLINKAISGINGLNIDIPDWVPGIGGKTFGLNIPQIPTLATGGFTSGPSVAGEAGQEAVISFQPSVRSENVRTWVQAGQMLGVTGTQAAEAANVSSVYNTSTISTAHSTPSTSNVAYYANGGFTNGISIAGEAGREAVISFKPGVRSENIRTWVQAGQMLGVTGTQAAEAARISSAVYYENGGFTGGSTLSSIADYADKGGAGGSTISNVTNYVGGATGDSTISMLPAKEDRPEKLEQFDDDGDDGPDWRPNGGGGGGTLTITYAPTIVVQGNADRKDIDAALSEDKVRFERMMNEWYERKMRNERRGAFR